MGELRLPYIRAQLPNLLTEAADADLNPRDFLIMLCRHERTNRRTKSPSGYAVRTFLRHDAHPFGLTAWAVSVSFSGPIQNSLTRRFADGETSFGLRPQDLLRHPISLVLPFGPGPFWCRLT